MEIEHDRLRRQDAQFLESRRFSVEEIARGLRLSPHKLSD
jgi:phage portal protein BeeE